MSGIFPGSLHAYCLLESKLVWRPFHPSTETIFLLITLNQERDHISMTKNNVIIPATVSIKSVEGKWEKEPMDSMQQSSKQYKRNNFLFTAWHLKFQYILMIRITATISVVLWYGHSKEHLIHITLYSLIFVLQHLSCFCDSDATCHI